LLLRERRCVLCRWRWAFWLEALAMTPFALFCLLAPPIDITKAGAPHAKEIWLSTAHAEWKRKP